MNGQGTKKNGFTLIEMAVVVLVIGLMGGLFFKVIRPFIESMRYLATETRNNNVEEALAIYVARNFRLPCPADPSIAQTAGNFGYEAGSGPNGDTPPVAGGCTITEGILPFRTLGLSRLDALDGWSRFMTYAISADFGKPVWATTALNSVHEMCRSQNWLTEVNGLTARTGPNPEDTPILGTFDPPGTVAGTTPISKNPWKAKFCCMAPVGGADLTILDQNGLDVMLPQAAWQLDNTSIALPYASNGNSYRFAGIEGYAATTSLALRGTRYDPFSLDNPKYRVNDPFPDTSWALEGGSAASAPAAASAFVFTGPGAQGLDTDTTDYRGRAVPAATPIKVLTGWTVAPIYVLVSHGPNGFGAYKVDGTATRVVFDTAVATAASPDAENADGDTNFRYSFIKNSTPALSYDDLLSWGTQETLLLNVGQSCVTP